MTVSGLFIFSWLQSWFDADNTSAFYFSFPLPWKMMFSWNLSTNFDTSAPIRMSICYSWLVGFNRQFANSVQKDLWNPLFTILSTGIINLFLTIFGTISSYCRQPCNVQMVTNASASCDMTTSFSLKNGTGSSFEPCRVQCNMSVLEIM